MQTNPTKDPDILQLNIRELLDHIHGIMLTTPSVSGWWRMIGIASQRAIIVELIKAAIASDDINSTNSFYPLGANLVFQELKNQMSDSTMDDESIETFSFMVLELLYSFINRSKQNFLLTYGLQDYRVQGCMCDVLVLRRISTLPGVSYEAFRL